MRKLNRASWMVLCACFFAACDRIEEPVPPHDPGPITTSQVSLGPDYRWQIYFDLSTNRVVQQVRKTTWDIGLEAAPQGYRVILNGSKAMFALDKGATDFASIQDTAGFTAGKTWDATSGNLDSTALGDWRNGSHVYIIDRGISETGAHQGFWKLHVQAVDANGYTLRFAKLDGSEDATLHVPKDSACNFTFLSFNGGGTVVQVEPSKTEWDLCFTQYIHLFYDPYQPYLVTGVLQNRHATTVAVDSLRAFEEINASQIPAYQFQAAHNVIGYSWKVYAGGTYITLPDMNYIIRDQDGYHYKLHFVDFYDQSGLKGSPKWEFQTL